MSALRRRLLSWLLASLCVLVGAEGAALTGFDVGDGRAAVVVVAPARAVSRASAAASRSTARAAARRPALRARPSAAERAPSSRAVPDARSRRGVLATASEPAAAIPSYLRHRRFRC